MSIPLLFANMELCPAEPIPPTFLILHSPQYFGFPWRTFASFAFNALELE